MDVLGFVLIGCSLAASLGGIVGSLTGLLPGLHPNTLASFFGAFPQLIVLFVFLSSSFSPIPYSSQILFGCFLLGVLISHSMTEMIPTSALGIADGDSISVLLPTQRLFSMGRADLIAECVVLGSVGALLLFTLSFYPVRCVMGSPGGLYALIEPYLGEIVLAICIVILLSESVPKRVAYASILFALSGIIGMVILTLDIPSYINRALFGDRWVGDPSIYFLPAFSGFFALPSLLLSRKASHFTVSPATPLSIPRFSRPKALMRSLFPMILVGWIPGITNSYATRLSERGPELRQPSTESICSYLVTYSATNIGGSLQSIIALSTILRARNGILDSIKNNVSFDVLLWLDPSTLPLAFLSFAWASVIAIALGVLLFRALCRRMLERRDMRWFNGLRVPIMMFILLLSLLTSGPIGLLVSFTCFLLALLAIKMNISRVHLLGFLLVPVIAYFLIERVM